MKRTHMPNCDCYECNPGDNYISHLKSQYGKNRADNLMMPARVGVYGMTNNFQSRNHADAIVATEKVSVKDIFGDALGGVIGKIIQDKKDGKELPKALDAVATLGIKTEKAAVTAAQQAAEKEVGKNVLKFSPMIIAGIVGVVLLVVYLIAKK